MVQQILSTNTFTTAKWIVSATASDGTHTTIAAATAAASSGDIIAIRPGTYTENLTLKSGISYVSLEDAQTGVTPKVIIVGKMIDNGSVANVSFRGIMLQTNSDFILVLTAASDVNFNLCYINCTNNTGFSIGNGSANVNLSVCDADLGTTGIHLWSITGGVLSAIDCIFANTGSSVSTGTLSGGSVLLKYSNCSILLATSSTGVLQILYSTFGSIFAATNTTWVTTAGSGISAIFNSIFYSGTSSAISIGTGTQINIYNTNVNSSNTNAITGAGTIVYSGLTFGNSSVMNVTTQTPGYVQLGKSKAAGQPAFFAYLGTTVTNATGDGTAFVLGTTTALTKVTDQGGDLNTNGTFTAPVTGLYRFSCYFALGNLGVSTGSLGILRTTGGDYYLSALAGTTMQNTTTATLNFGGSTLIPMTAGQTATAVVLGYGTTKTLSVVSGGANPFTSYFSGNLVC